MNIYGFLGQLPKEKSVTIVLSNGTVQRYEAKTSFWTYFGATENYYHIYTSTMKAKTRKFIETFEKLFTLDKNETLLNTSKINSTTKGGLRKNLCL
jgi:hypothetical protein